MRQGTLSVRVYAGPGHSKLKVGLPEAWNHIHRRDRSEMVSKIDGSQVPSREDAASRAETAASRLYIVIPASQWGGQRAVFGPMTEHEARERLDVYLPLYMPECPPKLLLLVEDYGQEQSAI